MTIMGKGNILALEDIARLEPHSYSVKCVSQEGMLLMIEKGQFQNNVRHFQNGFQKINQMNTNKWKNFITAIELIDEQKAQIETNQKQMTVKQEERFGVMDFFMNTYFSKQMDKKKMDRIFEKKVKQTFDQDK